MSPELQAEENLRLLSGQPALAVTAPFIFPVPGLAERLGTCVSVSRTVYGRVETCASLSLYVTWGACCPFL